MTAWTWRDDARLVIYDVLATAREPVATHVLRAAVKSATGKDYAPETINRLAMRSAAFGWWRRSEDDYVFYPTHTVRRCADS